MTHPSRTEQKKDNTSTKNSKKEEITQSTTDPESGLFVKGEHRRQFAYEAHTACDKNGFILEAIVTPGNVHDSVAFDDVYDKLVENFPEIETIVADSAYKTPHICKKIFGDGRVLSTAYKKKVVTNGGNMYMTNTIIALSALNTKC